MGPGKNDPGNLWAPGPGTVERMNEKAVEARLRRKVKELGGRAEKFVSGRAGVPDRVVLLPGGRVWFVELKDVGGRVSAAQVVWQQRARALGANVVTLGDAHAVDAWAKEREEDG